MPVTNVKSKWSSGDLVFYQSTAANGNTIQFGGASDDMALAFYGTNHDAAGTVSGSQTGYITVNINGTVAYIPTYAAVN